MLILFLLATALLPLAQVMNDPPSPSSALKEHSQSMIPVFVPPSGWQCALPKNLSQYVRVGFIGNGSTQFHPSINLAIEDVDTSQREYVKAVKEIHLADPKTTWRDLGKFTMKAGVGNLTEISSSSAWGEVKMLQAILVQNKKAYILTAAVLKKDYTRFQKEILESLQSLSLYPDLIAALPNENQRIKFKQLFAVLGKFSADADVSHLQKTQWEQVQKEVIEDYPEMGGHWHFLVLREGYEKIYLSAPPRILP